VTPADTFGMAAAKQLTRTALITVLVVAILGITVLGANGLLTGFGNMSRGSDPLHGMAFRDFVLGTVLLVLASVIAWGAWRLGRRRSAGETA
jgi:hypothetical protein